MRAAETVARAFRLSGRSTRLPWWIATLAVTLGGFALFDAVALLLWLEASLAVETAASLAAAAFMRLLLVPVELRRLHDRNKPAWWLVPYSLVPLVVVQAGDYRAFGLAVDAGTQNVLNVVGYGLSLLALLDLGCQRGTRGPNRYGPDPLDPDALDPREAEVFD